MQIMTRSSHRCSLLFRLALGAVLAASLIGCSGKIALKPIQVPCPGVDIYAQSWSPDGSQIVYFVSDQGGTTRLQLFELASGDATTVAERSTDRALAAGWSPDSSRWLTGIVTAPFQYEMRIIDRDGSERVLPINGVEVTDYQWSPNGQQIALTYQNSGTPSSDLVILTGTGEVVWHLSDTNSEFPLIKHVYWSPDGRQLAFGTYVEPELKLAVISASRENLQLYPLPDALIASIEWSPDGQWIGVNTFDPSEGTQTMNLFSVDSIQVQVWVEEFMGDWHWLPDSSGIIYHNNAELMTLSLDGTRTVLSAELKGNYAAGYFLGGQFSPNATMLAYTFRGQYGADDLYIMNVDGTNIQQLTDNPGNHKCFQWPF
jgi:Tol biopolymer transport system component